MAGLMRPSKSLSEQRLLFGKLLQCHVGEGGGVTGGVVACHRKQDEVRGHLFVGESSSVDLGLLPARSPGRLGLGPAFFGQLQIPMLEQTDQGIGEHFARFTAGRDIRVGPGHHALGQCAPLHRAFRGQARAFRRWSTSAAA